MTDPITCLALAIYFEARSESLAGQYLVANTIMNRVDSPRYPSSICGVVMQKHQFSFYWDGKDEVIRDAASWDIAMFVAENYIKYDLDYFDGCHYHADYVKPKWATAYKVVMQEGTHIFYSGGC